MAKPSRDTGKITNRRARFDYALGESLVVGLQLTGAETKSLRLGHGELQGAYVTIQNGELYLLNARIHSSPGIEVQDETRSRKLLAKHREIAQLSQAKQNGLTILPLEILTKSRYIKLRIATGKGKKEYDKRETIKRRQEEREIARKART